MAGLTTSCGSQALLRFDRSLRVLERATFLLMAGILQLEIHSDESVYLASEVDSNNGGAASTAPSALQESFQGQFDAYLAWLAPDFSGSGQAVAVNQDGTINSPENPALRGSVVVLYGTWIGATEPASVTGALVSLLSVD